MAASAAALALGVKAEQIEHALASFRGLPHRIEVVHEHGGVTYIDDSKGTNVGAVVEAIDALAAPIILIAGGLDKGGDYAPLRRPLEEKVKLAIFNGAARDKMAAALDGATQNRIGGDSQRSGRTCGARGTSGRHRAAVAGVFELRSIQGLCGTWERI